MLRFFTFILAAVGLLAVLSHPLTRRGMDVLTGLWGKSGSALVMAANKPESTAAVVISTAVPVGVETASLPPEAEGEADAGAETVMNGEAEKEAVIQPEAGSGEDAESEAGAESGKVFEIYKNAEEDTIDTCISNVLCYGLEVHYAPIRQPETIGTTAFAGRRSVQKWIPAC